MAGKNVVQVIGPSYHLADKKAAVQSAVNCYLQGLHGGIQMMQGTPGEALLFGFGAEIRGMRNIDGRLLAVSGDALYEIFPSDEFNPGGYFVLRGELRTDTGFVGLAHNRDQVAIVDGDNLYVFTLATNVLTRIVSEGWRGSDDVHELDGYFIFVDPNTDQFYLSAIDDASSLDALDFSSADSAPDNIVTHRVSHRQAWFFGDFSAEIWINNGGLDFPFVRYQSYTLDIGCVGKRAVINAADTLFFIGQSRAGRGIVYMLSGNQPTRVSNIAVEEALRASTDLSAATMWAYQIEGHEFIGINAPGMSSTWVFDAAMQQWHQRAEWLDGWAPLRSRLVTAFAGEHYAGDIYGNIVRLDARETHLAGRPLVRERTWPHLISPSLEPISFKGLELAMQTGQGGVISLEISNDGGATFGAPLHRSLGAVGRVMQRVRWNALGLAFNRVFRLRVSDAAPFAIYGATVVV